MTTSTDQIYDHQLPPRLELGVRMYTINPNVQSEPGPSSLSTPHIQLPPLQGGGGDRMPASLMDWQPSVNMSGGPSSIKRPISFLQGHDTNAIALPRPDGNGRFATSVLQHASGSKKQRLKLKLSQPKPTQNGDSIAHRSHLADATSSPREQASFTHKSVSRLPNLKIEEDTWHGSESFDSTSRHSELDTDSRGTPNDSMTSGSIIEPSHIKSSSPMAPETSGDPNLSSAQKEINLLVQLKFRPRSSIPNKLPAGVYGQQCVAAAYASRLNPYALHPDEHRILRDRLCHLHTTVYLNIRNGILRLWTRNPMVSVTREEALGCAKDYRWVYLASFAYDWLVRKGYVNFGCVEIPVNPKSSPKKNRRRGSNQPTIVIIGAGMSGLGSGRQLQGLLEQYSNRFSENGPPPRVVILEGRKRIGGRIYSHPLSSLTLPKLTPGLRPTAEMGAQIITGFNHGNPLDPIVRSQLALPYHSLKDVSTLYDTDGSPVDEAHDSLVEALYNDILDRSGHYRHTASVPVTAEGDKELIDFARDISGDDGVTIAQFEEATASGTIDLILPRKSTRKGVGHKAKAIGSSTGITTNVGPSLSSQSPAAMAAQSMGWNLKAGIPPTVSLSLDEIANSSNFQTLGTLMNTAVMRYKSIVDLTPKDMRLMNWHFANLEYANAANIGNLSLASWDQDTGNEFEGEHAEVVGGYQQVPRGILNYPTRLDVRTRKVASRICYQGEGARGKSRVICEDGDVIEADKIILTASLGVMKEGSIQFDPPLPDWKTGAISRLGFGLLNKVILVFETPFWDVDRDMFGLLREPRTEGSLHQEEYISGRGQFYLFWNIVKTSGLPCLVALMAGDSAHAAETTSDDILIRDVTEQLRNVFGREKVPDPLETIVTRWKSDRFARGSYSYVAAQALPGDYDLMAKPVGNLFFAGEATCGTHPATVHGAYLSGLRVASEVFESIVGPIEKDLSIPLVAPKVKQEPQSQPLSKSHERALVPAVNPSQVAAEQQQRRQSYETAIQTAILTQLGPRPIKPTKTGINPFLLYQKDHWAPCKAQCDAARQAATRNPEAKAGRDDIRAALGQMWRNAGEEVQKPYKAETETNKASNAQRQGEWKERVAEWDRKASEVRIRFAGVNPFDTFFTANGDIASSAAAGIEPATHIHNDGSLMELDQHEDSAIF